MSGSPTVILCPHLCCLSLFLLCTLGGYDSEAFNFCTMHLIVLPLPSAAWSSKLLEKECVFSMNPIPFCSLLVHVRFSLWSLSIPEWYISQLATFLTCLELTHVGEKNDRGYYLRYQHPLSVLASIQPLDCLRHWMILLIWGWTKGKVNCLSSVENLCIMSWRFISVAF